MTKNEFLKVIKAEDLVVGFERKTVSPAMARRTYSRWEVTSVPFEEFNNFCIFIHPHPVPYGPGHCYNFQYTEIVVPSRTASPYSKANADFINGKLAPYRRFWKAELTAFKRTAAWRNNLADTRFFDLCLRAGLDHDEHGSGMRGDYHQLKIIERCHKSDLGRYHASGDNLGLVEQSRKRTYAKSSNWGPSWRKDRFLVGENENGTPFVHQVPNNITSIDWAINWIWRGAEIIARHGDVGLAKAAAVKHVAGENVENFPLHDNHLFTGEIYKNGALYIKNGALFHGKEQHPDVTVGPEWVRVVIGRRSSVGMSSMD